MNIKIDKNLIATYMSLDNKKADEYLANLGSQIKTEITNSSDNDEVFEYLTLLTEFVYKVPKETVEIVRHIIERKPIPPTIHKAPFGEFEGKSHKDLMLKGIELLGHIRYIVPDEVLKLAAQLSLYEDSANKGKALEVVKKLSQYDYTVLTKSKLGYGVQRNVLDFILAWPRGKQLQHIEFVETVLRELLNPSFEGTTSGLNDKGQYTITFHSGVVSPTDFLKKMRREAIDLTYELYKAADDPSLKLKLIGVFDKASSTPTDDLKYIVDIYRKIVFGETGEGMTAHLGIVSTIEERLYWINTSEKRKVEESEKLQRDILQDELYSLFRLLVCDPVTYQIQEERNTNEKTRGEKIDGIINSIKKASIEKWVDTLNKIASQHTLIEDWKFNSFGGFLQKLSEAKPKVADDILKRAFEADSPLKHFTRSFLYGFRIGAHFNEWDRYIDDITHTKDVALVTAMIFSLNLPDNSDLKELVRERDINLLEDITKRRGLFSFLKKEANDRTLQYALFNTLARNFMRSPKRIEPLIVKVIGEHPEYLTLFFSELTTATYRKLIAVKELHPKTIDFLEEKMVEIPDIDWHVQGLLLEIGEIYGLEPVLDVFMGRIRKGEKTKEKEGRRIKNERYEVVPYHFNPKLTKFIVEHPEYIKIASGWASEMTVKWSFYNWHVSHLFQRLEKGFNEIIASLIEKGGDDNLRKAALALHSIDGTSIELCIEIVRGTANEKILSQIDSNMYTTGVVFGEYGIAVAYEQKAKILEKYKADESDRVRRFADRMSKSFLDSAKRERQRSDEEKQLRRIEFEG